MATVKAVYKLARQQCQGFLASIFELMEIELPVVSQILFSDKRTILVRVPLSANSKEFFDKLHLRHIVPLTDFLHLSFANHTHRFNPAQGSYCCVR